MKKYYHPFEKFLSWQFILFVVWASISIVGAGIAALIGFPAVAQMLVFGGVIFAVLFVVYLMMASMF